MKKNIFSLLFILLIFAVSTSGLYVDPGSNSVLDYNHYIDPNDPNQKKIEPPKYSDSMDPTKYIPFSTVNGVKSLQGNINFYSSNNSLRITPEYNNSRINLVCDANSFIGDLNWTQLTNYPSGCPAGQAVQVIGDTLTCTDVNAGIGNGDVLGKANQITVTNGTDRLFGSADLNLSLPQDINIFSSPNFFALVVGDASGTDTTIIGYDKSITFGQGSPATIIADGINFIAGSPGSYTFDVGSGYEEIIASGAEPTNIGRADLRFATGYFENLDFIGTINGGDFNLSLNDLNNSQSCSPGQALQSVGSSTSCVSISSSGGTTYTSGTPATLQVSNDTNTISLNFDGNFNSRFALRMPLAGDVNVSKIVNKLIAGGNIVLSCTGSDSNGTCTIGVNDSNLSGTFVKSSVFNAAWPVADANISSSSRWNADVNWDDISLLFPVPDVNVLNSVRYKQDSSCDSNLLCTTTNKITTTVDANFQNIKFNGRLSGGDFNIAFRDLNDVPSSYVGQALKIVQVNASGTGLDFNSVSLNDTNCSNNTGCVITGKITTTQDANFQNIKFTGTLSGGDFNFSLGDANGSQTASANGALSSVGQTVTSISVPTESNIDGNALGIINGLDLNNSLSYLKIDSNKIKVSENDTNAEYLFTKLQAGNGITLSIQNPGGDENILISSTGSGTDTNCSNNSACIITGRINSGFDGNFQLDLNIGDDLVVNDDQNIGDDLNVRGDITVDHLGIGSVTPSVNSIVNAGSGDIDERNIIFGNINYIGTGDPSALNIGIDYNGASNTITSLGANIYSRDLRNIAAQGSADYIGLQVTTGLVPNTRIVHTQGAHTYSGIIARVNGTDSLAQLSGGNYIIRSIWQQKIGDFNIGSILFGGVWNNDVQFNTDVNVYFDGTDDGNKGDTFLVHPSDVNNLKLIVDGNLNTTFDNNANVYSVRSVFQQDINAQGGVRGIIVSAVALAPNTCTTICDTVDGIYSNNWTCIGAANQAAATTCADVSLTRNCFCKN